MQYQGGKWKLRSLVSDILNSMYRHGHVTGYIEPFVGGGSVLHEVCKWFNGSIIASDYNADLIVLWQALASGWVPPDVVTEEEYLYYKNTPNSFKSALKTFILIGCSFGAKWKGGFARDSRKSVPFSTTSKTALLSKFKTMRNVNFKHCSFSSYNSLTQQLIYADPPYRDTTSYKAVGTFNVNAFDDWCRSVSKNNYLLISEYSMPADFICIHSVKKSDALQSQSGRQTMRTERLFIHSTCPLLNTLK